MDYLCPECGPIDEDTGIDVYDCATNFICKKCGANECYMTPLVDAYRKLQAQRDELRELLRDLSSVVECERLDGNLKDGAHYKTHDDRDLFLSDLLDRADAVLSASENAHSAS